MKKIFLLLPVLFLFFMTSSFGAGQCGLNHVTFQGTQKPEHNEFIYENLDVYNEVSNNFDKKIKNMDLKGMVWECDKKQGCSNAVVLPAGSVFKGAETIAERLFVCSTYIQDRWYDYDVVECGDDFYTNRSEAKLVDTNGTTDKTFYTYIGRDGIGYCYENKEKTACKNETNTQWTNGSCICLSENEKIRVWNGENCVEKIVESGSKLKTEKEETETLTTTSITSSNQMTAITDSSNENNKNVKFSCPESDLQNIYMWQSQYATNSEISSLISNILTYCFETNDIEEYQFRTYMARLKVLIEVQQNLADEAQKASELAKQQQLLQQQNAAKERIASIVNNLDQKAANFKRSDWKNEDGKFNTSRLISDSVAGVVLGTAGGLITSSVVKKSQVKSGFEDLNCAIGGQVVAGWGDEFLVGIQ